MRYIVLIYGDEAAQANATPDQRQALMVAHNAFGAEATKRGVMISGEALYATNTATTVRIRDGKTITTDGPFAETKEQLGGFYMINCKDLDEAINVAAMIPGADTGSMEIRPLVEFN